MIRSLFCSTCHVFIANYVQDKDGTQLLKNGKPYGARMRANLFKDVTGKEISGFPVRCRHGHLNYITDSPEAVAEEIKLSYNFGYPCPYHYRKGATCTVRQPCKECVVRENYLKNDTGVNNG